MSKALKAALAIQVLIMISVLIPPMINKSTGTSIYLQTERVDPRALFRGDYVILNYPMRSEVSTALVNEAFEEGSLIYVTVTKDRPAQFVSASLDKPVLAQNEACIVARADETSRWNSAATVIFPQVSQFFVPEGTGREIEQNLSDMVAKISVTKSCNAVLLDLEYL